MALPVLTGCPGEGGDDGASAEGSSGDDATDTDEEPTGTETGDQPTGTETGAPPAIEGCECIPVQTIADSDAIPEPPTCGVSLCPDVTGTCAEGSCSDVAFVLADAAALECAITALRDRTPGVITWSWSENGGQYEDDGYILIDDNGHAVRRDWGWGDLSYRASPAKLGELMAPAEYDACLALPDDLARFDCMRASLVVEDETCDSGWSYEE